MARPRSFETDAAVEKAMQVFWAHGYEGASLPDLLDGMGLTRGSLYKAFTDKKSLFLRVLNFYEGRAVQVAIDVLADQGIPDGSDRIRALFTNVYRAVRDGDQRGCLLCAAAAGPSMYDDDIASVVAQGLSAMRDAIDVALQASPKHAQMPDAARRDMADMLIAQYIGLCTMARARMPADTLRNAARSVGAILA